MYKRNSQGWTKHFDFYVLDVLVLQISFLLAAFLRNRMFAYVLPAYRILAAVLVLVDLLVLTIHNSMHNVITRGNFKELSETVKHCFYVFAVTAVYMFAVQSGVEYSRIALFITAVFHIVLGYLTRILWKYILKAHGKAQQNKRAMLVVAAPETAVGILTRLGADTIGNYKIAGVVLTGGKATDTVCGYPVVAELENAADYICREWIDSVYIDAPLSDERVLALMDACTQMAIPTHYHIPNMSRGNIKRFPEKIGGTTVLTSSINYATPRQVVMKRAVDLLGGIVGSIAALLIIIVIGPIIKKLSPGPILFKQERIGKNGKRFKIYKIRSMYMDAEERKLELLEQNRVKDGMMFKLDFDPRIIGNEILPDGTQKTGIGDFIRRTSLDEFPQFFNVLAGQMSLVGTRPPTVDEWEKYKYHHRARLAIKPGITGMWQVSGRSEITDFEEVVRLDTEYITNWSPALDLKILFRTVGVLFSHKGAM